MSGLFAALSSTARALEAQQTGLETVGQNIANANTPGYARRRVDFAEVAPTDKNSPGGVTVQDIQALRDIFTEHRLWSQQPLEQQQGALANLLAEVQSAVGTPGHSLDGSFAAFFGAFSSLAQDPTSATARQGVVLQGQALGTAFSQIAGQLSAAQSDADRQVAASIGDINNFASQVAALNASLNAVGGASSPGGQTVVDQLNVAVGSLSNVVSITVTTRADGQLDVSFAGGRALVVGGNVYAVSAGTTSSGLVALKSSDGTDVTAAVTGGRVGGLLQARDTNIPGYRTQLDTLAYTVVQQVNTQHQAGFDLNGAAGGNFFTPIATLAGAAQSVSVNPAIVANSAKVAAAGAPTPGDNQNARAIANLRDARIVGGTSTLADGWGGLVYQIGRDTQLAQQGQQTQAAIVRQLQTLRDATSGVSIDEEAAMMMKFQRAYEANARFFQTVNETIGTLFNLIPAQ